MTAIAPGIRDKRKIALIYIKLQILRIQLKDPAIAPKLINCSVNSKGLPRYRYGHRICNQSITRSSS